MRSPSASASAHRCKSPMTPSISIAGVDRPVAAPYP
jgi:hypothetical protein